MWSGVFEMLCVLNSGGIFPFLLYYCAIILNVSLFNPIGFVLAIIYYSDKIWIECDLLQFRSITSHLVNRLHGPSPGGWTLAVMKMVAPVTMGCFWGGLIKWESERQKSTENGGLLAQRRGERSWLDKSRDISIESDSMGKWKWSKEQTHS